MATNDYTYTQLDLTSYVNMINSRIRDLEVQYATLNLRISAPSPTDVVTEQDRQNLAQISTSLDFLHGLVNSVQTKIDNPPSPIPEPAPTPAA